MPRFTSFSSHVEDIIKKFHQAINDADHDFIKSLWLNEEAVSLLDQTGELSLGIDTILEVLSMRQNVKVELLGCKSHSFAGLIITETLEAWSPVPQTAADLLENDAELIKNIKSTEAIMDHGSGSGSGSSLGSNISNSSDVEYIYGTYITTQNYPDWQFMRIHLSYANYGVASYRCFENVKGFH
jgi:hypothetical protein